MLQEKKMMLDATKTVRELAVQFPQATRVFEQAGIDYCCGGEKLLGDACQSAGVDLQVLERMLETSSSSPAGNAIDFQRLSITELIMHILDTHHVFTKREMARLDLLMTKVAP